MGSCVGRGADVKGPVGSAQLGALEGERSERGRERAAAQVERRQLATLLQEAAQREMLVRAEHSGLMSTALFSGNLKHTRSLCLFMQTGSALEQHPAYLRLQDPVT